MSKNIEKNQSLTLEYELLSLPSAQHKAGLAGLVLLIEAMDKQRLSPLPEITKIGPIEIKINLTLDTLTSIFNELYDAMERKATKTTNNLSASVDVKEKSREMPRARFMETLGLHDKPKWLQLWRDAVYKSVRSGNTRQSYQGRFKSESLSSLAQKEWKSLTSRENTISLSNSALLGAQKWSSEYVSFKGNAKYAFLLHFWPITALSFVPQQVEHKKGQEFGELYILPNHFFMIVPEVANLEEFIRIFPNMLAGSLEEGSSGYRPSQAIVSLAAEGVLQYAMQLQQLAAGTVRRSELAYCASGFVAFHVYQKGPHPMSLRGIRRDAFDDRVIDKYRDIWRIVKHPLLKSLAINNLLKGRPWYADLFKMVERTDAKLLVNGSNPNWSARLFSGEVGKLLMAESCNMQTGATS